MEQRSIGYPPLRAALRRFSVVLARLRSQVQRRLKKGAQIYVEGRLQTRKWQDKDGHDRYTTEIVANDMQMLGSRGGAGVPSGDNFNQDQPAATGNAGGAEAKKATSAVAGDFDDDIPF